MTHEYSKDNLLLLYTPPLQFVSMLRLLRVERIPLDLTSQDNLLLHLLLLHLLLLLQACSEATHSSNRFLERGDVTHVARWANPHLCSHHE